MVGERSCKDEEEGTCHQMWRHSERWAHLMGLLDRANKHSRNKVDIPPLAGLWMFTMPRLEISGRKLAAARSFVSTSAVSMKNLT